MKRLGLALTTSCLFLSLLAADAAPSKYRYRWVYVSSDLSRDAQVEEIRSIVKTASEHGINGMVFSGGFDSMDRRKPDYFTRLKSVADLCRERNVEIIPAYFSIGWGGGILSHNRNLAEGLPVRDEPFIVTNGKAQPAPDPDVRIANGGFEEYRGNTAAGFRYQDQPGRESFIDTQVFHEGKASLRFQDFTLDPGGQARVTQEVAVKPFRCYRFSCWVRTEGLQPVSSFRLLALTTKSRDLAGAAIPVPSTSDWRKVSIGFNSGAEEKVRLYVGTWGGKSGKFWVDDWRLEEAGLVNVLRRAGTPVVVKDARTGVVYDEGKDYRPVSDPLLDFRFDHDGPGIAIVPGGRIAEGSRLLVSYYHGVAVNDGQVTACMSEPEVYDIGRKQTELIARYLSPKKYFLAMDEVRAGGTCKACADRRLTMAEILGDCVSKQCAIVRSVSPGAEVFIWSDMLDPTHNAHAGYYLVEGDLSGSWKHIPKDTVIVCWHFDKRKESLAHFSSLGFRTLAGAYYDGDTLDNPKAWIDALDATPGASGIMYTTWRNKYGLLGAFGDLVRERK